ncbi:MAG: SdpI family protein [Planctomycetota bacterium]|jgi:uncharacterized membrane protein
MKFARLSLYVLFLIILLGIIDTVYYYPQLPDRVASHFGSSGEPDDWMSKTGFLVVSLGFMLFMGFFLFGIAYLCAVMVSSDKWDHIVNLPNKDYWLAPERRRQTGEFIYRYMLWMNSAVMLFMVAVFHQTIRYNLGRTDHLEDMGWLLCIFLGFMGVWLVGLFVKFCRRPREF